MILGIHHTALSVPDLDEALDFYRGVLGFEVEMNAGWPSGAESFDRLVGLADSASKGALVRLGDSRIEIFQYRHPEGAPQDPKRPVCDHGITHICLRLTGIEEECARLERAGVRFNRPPVDLGGDKCVYGRDPFGNVLELVEKA